MNMKSNKWMLMVVFFLTLGLVCIDSAGGDETADLTDPVGEAVFADEGTVVVSEDVLMDSVGDEEAVDNSGSIVVDEVVSADDGAEAGMEDEDDGLDSVDLNVQDATFGNVLQLLSIQGQKNILPSSGVSTDTKMTVNLYDVDFYDALDAILQQNGCGYIEKGNFLFVHTLEELRRIRQAERKVEYRLFRLNYITAAVAESFVGPLLSSAGTIKASGDVKAGIEPKPSDVGADSSAHSHVLFGRDYKENIEEIAKVIAELDTKPLQVLVEATILQADITENLAFGVDFSVLSNMAIEGLTSPLSGIGDVISGTISAPSPSNVITSTVGNVATGSAGIKVGLVTNNVAAFIRALDSVTDTTILANPKVMVLNRQRADVLVGKKIGYLSTTATATSTTQTVEFLNTGTKLTLRPFVSEKNGKYEIRLELRPAVSEGSIRTTGTETVPDEDTQELMTNVLVADGQTVVLGGLFKEKTTIERDQVPGVGNIPIVGAAFKGRDDTATRTEVIFLITPHVIRDESLYAAGATAADDVEMVRIGSRKGLLPWSREKMTAAHLRNALGYIEKNDPVKAEWEVDLALGLEPGQLEAIRLKEKLTGQRVYWPSNSYLDQAVETMIEDQTGARRNERRVRSMAPEPYPSGPQSDGEPLFEKKVVRVER